MTNRRNDRMGDETDASAAVNKWAASHGRQLSRDTFARLCAMAGEKETEGYDWAEVADYAMLDAMLTASMLTTPK